MFDGVQPGRCANGGGCSLSVRELPDRCGGRRSVPLGQLPPRAASRRRPVGREIPSLEREKLDDAAAWFRQGIAKFPDDISSATGLGIAYLELRKYEEARRCFLDLLQRKSLPPDQEAIVQNNLVWANLMLGDPELRPEADRLSKNAFGCLPWTPEVRGTRGSVLVELGEFETGMSMLERSLAAHHDDRSKALNAAYIALALTRQGLPVEAARRLEQARKLDPKCPLLGRVEAEIENAKRQAAT